MDAKELMRQVSEMLDTRILGRSLTVLECTESTNTLLRALAREGVSHGTAVAALSQTGGRGRLGRSFASPEGGVYLSILLRTGMTAADCTILTALAAVAFRDALAPFCPQPVGIKWVNDLVVSGRKLAGILAEGVISPEGAMEGVVIGVGVNIGAVPDEVSDIACALPADTADRASVIAALINSLERTLTRPIPDVMADYRAASVVIGRRVDIPREGGDIPALVTGIDDSAHLLCRDDTGREYCLSSGEIRIDLRKIYE